jgi:hypothetical protein
MTQVYLDSSASSKLGALNQPAEVCDPTGRVLGKFVPASADEFDPREAYPFVDKTMGDADAGDPTLADYQRHGSEARP